MNFVNHTVLWMIPAVVPVVCWFLWWNWRRRQALVRLFVSERLLPQLLEGVSPTRQKIKLALQAGAVLFLLLALARPQWGFVWEEANQRGRDILVAIDTSRSMLAEDMAPNRLTRAKLAALDLLRLATNDRLGLIAFAGGAFLQSPLTLDDEAFRQNVNELDTTIIPQGGTSLSEAIDTALKAFATEEGDNHHVLVIFTDGEDQDTGALEAAEKAAEKNLRIFTVGVGTPAGELLKVTDENGKSSYIKDAEGNVVKSRLNEDLLRQIATKANGFYLALREGNAMQTLYRQGLEPLPTSEISSKLVRHLNEQFHWPLGIAIALLLAEMLLPPAPKKRLAVRESERATAVKVAVALIFLMLAIPANASSAKAYKNYQNGNFKDARNEYERLLEKKPDDPKLRYNAGAAAYKAGAYDAAVKDFAAAANALDLNLQEMAYYNLGNSNYKLGNDESDPQKKMGLWRQAVQNFESSLKLNPKDADAAFNRDLVKKRLEELQKQQPKQDQKQDQNKDNKDDKKDQEKQDQKDQQKQQQDNKDEKDQKDQQKQDQQQQQKDNKDSKSQQQKEQEEKEKQEQQQKEQQQGKDQKDQAAKDKKDAQKEGGKEKTDQEQKDAKEEAEQEARAMALGQMTQKQAQQMLDSQKADEKALIYRQTMETKKGRERALKDW